MSRALEPWSSLVGARAANSVADLITVAGVLDGDAATLRAAATMLGLASAPVAGPAVPRPLVPVEPRVPAAGVARREPVSQQDGTAGVVRPAGSDPRRPRRPRLVTHAASTAPPWPVPAPVEQLLPVVSAVARPPEPLLRPSRQRAVLSALAAVGRPGREVDLDALVERVAVREPVTEVPRRPQSTTSLGVQLLVDHGPSMGPFRRDVRLLAAALRLVVGADAVDELAFHSDPHTVLPLSDDADFDIEEGPYPPPAGPRPVLAATDLGIGDPTAACPARWLRLAAVVRRAGSPLVILVPYPASRWPDWASALTLVHWDRATDAASARRAARHALRSSGMPR